MSTCSYEARKYGIHSAMLISLAYKLCPDAAFLSVNLKLYAGVSVNVMEILKGFAEKPGILKRLPCVLSIKDEVLEQEKLYICFLESSEL